MRQRFGREELHSALRDSPRFAQSISQQVQLPLRAEAVHQTFLAVDHVFWSCVSLFSQQSCKNSTLRRHRIDRVLHHRQLARYRCAQRAMVRSGNADRVLNLLPTQSQRAPGDDRRRKRRERCMMPAALANPWERRFAQPHLELMPEHEPDNQLLAVALGALAAGHRGRENIRRMRRILLPINVVVIHAADHERIRQRRRDRINPLACANYRCRSAARDLPQHFERDDYVMLLISAERAADRIEQVPLCLIHGFRREPLVLQSRCPLRHLCGNRFFACSSCT